MAAKQPIICMPCLAKSKQTDLPIPFDAPVINTIFLFLFFIKKLIITFLIKSILIKLNLNKIYLLIKIKIIAFTQKN